MKASEWDDWEAFDDYGFVHKRKKRAPPDPSTAINPPPSDSNRIKRRKNALLKLKQKYRSEIAHWELLSNTLNGLHKKPQLLQRLSEEDTFLVLERERVEDSAHGKRIDDLATRAEADQTITQEMSDLCDIAESVCNVREKHLKNEYSDLLLRASPRKMMAVLCNDGGKDIKSV